MHFHNTVHKNNRKIKFDQYRDHAPLRQNDELLFARSFAHTNSNKMTNLHSWHMCSS